MIPQVSPDLRPPDGPLADPAFVAGLRPIPSGPVHTGAPRPASDLVGVTPGGSSVEFQIDSTDQAILLVFLSTRCEGCDGFWRGLKDSDAAAFPSSVSAVVVTRGPTRVASTDVEAAARGISRVPVIMSDAGWVDYGVTGYPFFVLVDPASRTVVAETVGFGWPDVHAMIRAAGY